MPEPIRSNATPLPTPASDEPPPQAKARKLGAAVPAEPISAAARQLADKVSTATASGPTLQPASRPNQWWKHKLESELACLLPCNLALRAASYEMPEGGLAQKTLDHFLSGSATPVHVDLDAELARNAQLREYVASRIESEMAERAADGVPVTCMSGSVWVPQSAYGESSAGRDLSLSLGGTYFEYQVAGSAANGGLEVRLDVADNYFWSPADTSRPTQCLHACGSSLVAAKKAVEFSQVGEGTLVVDDPSLSEPMEPLDVEEQGQAGDDGQR